MHFAYMALYNRNLILRPPERQSTPAGIASMPAFENI